MTAVVRLYAGVPRAAVELAEPRSRSTLPVLREAIPPSIGDGRDCQRCALREGVHTVCVGAEGEPGGLMLIGESPGSKEDTRGRPFVGPSGLLLREQVAKHWRGPVAIDNAIRCAPGRREVTEKHVEACRGYLVDTIREVAPARIVTLGSWASFALFGRSVPPISSRRGYAYLFDVADDPVPCFFVLHPAAALRNRFVRAWFEADLAWALTVKPPRPAPALGVVRVVDSVESAREAIEAVRGKRCAFDVETAGILWNRSFRIEACSVAPVGDETSAAWLWDREAIRNREIRRPLEEWLADEAAEKVGHNVKFDVNAVRAAWGVCVRGVVGDTRLWRRLRDPEAGAKLDETAELVGMGGMKAEARAAMKAVVDRVKSGISAEKTIEKRKAEDAARRLGDTAKKWPRLSAPRSEGLVYLEEIGRTDPELAKVIRDAPSEWERYAYALVDREILARYNARDTIATARLAAKLPEALAEVPSLDRLRRMIVDRAGNAIAEVERWGVAADRAAIANFDRFLGVKIDEVKARIDAYGFDFNPDSPPQVARILFEVLKLRPPKLTDTGRASTDKEVLAELARKHPFARDLSEWRRLGKLRGTYAGSREGEGLWAHVREDGRIHTSILLDGAGTGRTSSQEPNLQNIPVRTAEGRMARDCFVAAPGCLLVQLDYSQLELRVAAMLSRDPAMISIFQSGDDYHTRTAQIIAKIAWGIGPDQVQKKHRFTAKTINFALLYGAGDAKIAEQIKTQSNGEFSVTSEDVAKIRVAILGAFRTFSQWADKKLAESRKTGQAWTWWQGAPARCRSLWKIGSNQGDDDGARITAEHSAVNTPVQGTGSDFCIASLTELVEWIQREGIEDVVKLVLPVHDSIMFECREDWVERVANKAREVMTGWPSDGVPLVVDVEVGRSWGSLAKWPPKPESEAA
jgi:uracil-DNA glycosylase family 4